MKKQNKKDINEEIINEEIIDIINVEPKQEVNGVGDIIKKVADTLSIPTCSDCEERRKKLNRMFPFTRRALRELTTEEIEYVEGIGTKLTYDTRLKLGEIYDSVFGGKTRHCSSCPGVYKTIIDRLIIQIGYQNIK